MVKSCNITFLLNVFIEGSQLKSDNVFYKYLSDKNNPQNLLKFMNFIDTCNSHITAFENYIEEKKNIFKYAKDYFMNEYLIVNSIIPFSSKFINKKTIFSFFQPYFIYADPRTKKFFIHLMNL